MAHNLNPDKQQRFGINRDIAEALSAKWSDDNAKQALQWVAAVSGQPIDIPATVTPAVFQEALKSGVVLCELLNKLSPGAVKQINKMKMPFMMRENITNFTEGVKAYGLRDTFVTVDLFEGNNLVVVLDCIMSLGGLAQSKGFCGPTLGVAGAGQNKNTENFKFEVKKTGDTNVVSLQTIGNSKTQCAVDNLGLKGSIIRSQDVGATHVASQQTSGSKIQPAEKRMDNINRLNTQ